MILTTALLLVTARPALSYTATHIGTFPDCVDTIGAFGYVNADGAVAFTTGDSDSPERAYFWKDGVLTEITVPDSMRTDAPGVVVAGLSNDGTVLGRANEPGFCKGFTWTKDFGLDALPERFEPDAINPVTDDLIGSTVVEGKWMLGRMHSHAFSPIMEIDQPNSVTAMNASGVAVAVPQIESPYIDESNRFLADGTKQVLTPIYAGPNHEKAPGTPLGINSGGWVVGVVRHFDGPSKPEIHDGAIWSPSNDLYRVPGRITFTGINDAGVIVGRQTTGRDQYLAVVYDTTNGVRDLNTLVASLPLNLSFAMAINNHGDILCVDSTYKEVYLLRPAH